MPGRVAGMRSALEVERAGCKDFEHCGLAWQQQDPLLKANKTWILDIVKAIEERGFERVRRLCRKGKERGG